MPIYEYSCKTCGRIDEKIVSFAEAKATIPCAECSGIMEKIISVPGYVWSPSKERK